MKTPSKFPLYLPGKNAEANNGAKIIAGKIGHKKTCLAEYISENGILKILNKGEYISSEYGSFTEIFNKFLKEKNLQKPSKISIGVSGPVLDGKSKAPYFSWTVDADAIKKENGLDEVLMINDLEAIAYSLCDCDSCLTTIYEGNSESRGNVAILAPGAGLGESGLFWDGQFLHPFATEGGHSEFAPRSEAGVQFYQFLNNIYGIVSWEKVLSEEGLFNIYRFNRDIGKHQEPNWLSEKIENEPFVDAVISAAKEKNARIAEFTLEKYTEFLAREANSLVLKLKATGGLVITGKIAIKIEEFLLNKDFYKKFIISDKMEHLLKDIPIYLFKNENAVLFGAANYGAFIKQ